MNGVMEGLPMVRIPGDGDAVCYRTFKFQC